MEKRPYFKSSIIEIEKVFENSKDDIKILEAYFEDFSPSKHEQEVNYAKHTRNILFSKEVT